MRIDSGHVVIEKWRDENEDGTWVWIESGFVAGEWMQKLGSLLGLHPRGSA